MGAPPHQSLVNDVFTRSAGNPYLNLLLVEGLRADVRHLPEGFPPDLESAVLRSWRGLSPGARRLTQIMALGGRAATSEELRAVAGSSVSRGSYLAMLNSAMEAGLVDLAPDGKYWFHHPLIAEALAQHLDVSERRRWHAAFAAVYERKFDGGARPGAADAIALADHHYEADHPADAYRWALMAADQAAAEGAFSDVLRLLRRAVNLWGALPGAPERARDLWTGSAQPPGRPGQWTWSLKQSRPCWGWSRPPPRRLKQRT